MKRVSKNAPLPSGSVARTIFSDGGKRKAGQPRRAILARAQIVFLNQLQGLGIIHRFSSVTLGSSFLSIFSDANKSIHTPQNCPMLTPHPFFMLNEERCVSIAKTAKG